MANVNGLTVVEVVKRAGETLYQVRDGANVVGYVRKFKDTRSTKHPYTAFTACDGVVADLVGHFYPNEFGSHLSRMSAEDAKGVVLGGKSAAVAAVAQAARR
jgi:hypothetical protein